MSPKDDRDQQPCWSLKGADWSRCGNSQLYNRPMPYNQAESGLWQGEGLNQCGMLIKQLCSQESFVPAYTKPIFFKEIFKELNKK